MLYASLGNYDKAKSALELAIHTHPSYATAHENLGDIYAQLASRAYDRALQLDKNNTTAQVKLAMVKDLFVAPKAGAPARQEPAKPSKADAGDQAGSREGGASRRPRPVKPETAKVEAREGEPAKAAPGRSPPRPPARDGKAAVDRRDRGLGEAPGAQRT